MKMKMKEKEAQLTERAHNFIRNKAAYAANRIPDLKKRLEAVGGLVLEPQDVTGVSDTETVALVNPAFESTEDLPGT